MMNQFKTITAACLAVLILSGCQVWNERRKDRKCHRQIHKAISGGCLDTAAKTTIQIDTFFAPVVSGSVDPKIDTVIQKELFLKDTCFSQARIDTIIKHLKIPTVHHDDSFNQLDIWLDKGVLKYDLKPKPRIQKTVTKQGPVIKAPIQKKQSNFWFWFVIILQAVVNLLLLVLMIIAVLKLKRSLI